MTVLTMLIVFRGEGEPVAHAKGFVRSRADGAVLKVEQADSGPWMEIQNPCNSARFDTMVFASGDQFYEAGRVDFAEIESYLLVETKRPGSSVTFADGSSAGSISWEIVGGGGRFDGAAGLVTGNFTALPTGQFFDHQVFKVALPQ